MPGQIKTSGVGAAVRYSRAPPIGPALYDPFVAPGDTNPPVIFGAPSGLTGGPEEIWIVATGGPNWGGCGVAISTDGDTFAQAGVIYQGGREGRLTGSLPSSADPDVGHTLGVDLTMSGGTLLTGSLADADHLVTLCWCDGELISYRTAALTAANRYNLTYLRRGAYGTTVATHASGTLFARVGPNEPSLFRYQFPGSFLGRPFYVKLPAFNGFYNELQDLDGLTVYTYTAGGAGTTASESPPPPAPQARPFARRFAHVLADIEDEALAEEPRRRHRAH